MKNNLILFSGEHCHLCDLAFQQLVEVSPEHAQHVVKTDVKSDTNLYHLYGARIPVFKRTDSGAELGWPFEPQQLREFLA